MVNHGKEAMKPEEVLEIIDKHRAVAGDTIAILREIQNKYGYLPEEALRIVAEKTGRSLVDLYAIATFYRSFRLTPRGKHLISVCMGTACHVRGSPMVAEEFQRQLGVRAGQTTSDGQFTLETVNCLGACALGPMVVVDGHYFPHMSKTKVRHVLDRTQEGLDKVDVTADERVFPVEVNCPRCNHSLMDPEYLIDGYPSIRLTISFGQKHGWVRLSSLYGSYTIASEHEIPMDTIIHNFCPHCHAELVGPSSCTECGAPMFPMVVRGGGMVQICSRRGCKNHMLDLYGVNF